MEDINQAVETPVDAPVADVTPAEPVAVETPVEAAPEVETTDATVAETGVTVAAVNPAHSIIDELDDAANALGSYAYSIIRPLLDKIRNVL
jgi:hypothetical protein